MSFVTDLQSTLEGLTLDSNQPPISITAIPDGLVVRTREAFSEWYRADYGWIDDWELELFKNSNGFPVALVILYKALISFGIEDEQEIQKLLLWYLDNYLLDSSGRHAKDILENEKGLILFALDAYKRFDPQEREILEYAIHNHLCHYGEGKWVVSGFGKTVLNLSELQAIRLLLSLEVFLNTGMDDQYHVSEKFLKRVYETGKTSLSILNHGYSDDRSNERSIELLYALRLINFSLLSILSDKTEECVLNDLGKITLGSVLTKDSVFDSLIPLFIREEIIGSQSPNFNTKEDFERFQKLLNNSPIVGELKQPILDEVNRFVQINAAYLSIFKGLAPCVEGLLRNICQLEGIEIKDRKINAYSDALKKAPHPILKTGTFEAVDKIFRDFRNYAEHGHYFSPEIARWLCELTLFMIETINREYIEFKEVKS